MQSVVRASFTAPEESREFDKTRIDIVALGTAKMLRLTLQPGWRWSQCMKPIVGSDSCHARHVGVAVSGHMDVHHNDGSSVMINSGDAYVIEPGHDAWITGTEPFVSYEFETAAIRLAWKEY